MGFSSGKIQVGYEKNGAGIFIFNVHFSGVLTYSLRIRQEPYLIWQTVGSISWRKLPKEPPAGLMALYPVKICAGDLAK